MKSVRVDLSFFLLSLFIRFSPVPNSIKLRHILCLEAVAFDPALGAAFEPRRQEQTYLRLVAVDARAKYVAGVARRRTAVVANVNERAARGARGAPLVRADGAYFPDALDVLARVRFARHANATPRYTVFGL